MTNEEKRQLDEVIGNYYRIEQEHDRECIAVLDIVKSKVSAAMFDDIRTILKESENCYKFSIQSTPKGSYQKEDFDTIKGYWVNQTTNGGYSGDEFAGTISIQLSTNEYFEFYYSM